MLAVIFESVRFGTTARRDKSEHPADLVGITTMQGLPRSLTQDPRNILSLHVHKNHAFTENAVKQNDAEFLAAEPNAPSHKPASRRTCVVGRAAC